MIEWRCRICGDFFVLGFWHRWWRKHDPEGVYP